MSTPLKLASAACLCILGCAGNSFIPESQRFQLEDELGGHGRYLKTSVYVTPFFADGNKLLLTARSPDELDLIDGPNGRPILPGDPIKILPAGTRLRIERITFPTSLEVTERNPITPRYNPWVLLKSADDFAGGSKPYVLVLRPDMQSRDEFLHELGLYLTDADPTAEIQSFPQPVQAAMAQKTVVSGMSPQQVEMAWGYPEEIHRESATPRSERWNWPQDKQRAWFSNGVLVNWIDHGRSGGTGTPNP